MPTDDERRKVASKLRDLACRENPSWPALMDLLGCPGRAVAVQYLADLIEPEERTCRDECDGEFDFHCSKCGCHLYLISIDNEPSLVLGEDDIQPSFCPSCGAKVVGK